ncbi:histone deacetylation protein Rxt3-domain-containing protein [Scheffersomyces xylosifermentans]|uniref:histone deacetylation protein Rxt3-domain-containing protein n=1 Tax=Scheffersomyces xylosifermentans TaxID=1304137 RepID=UPI00315D8435
MSSSHDNPSSSGSGGIRLPPISFLSGHSSGNKLPSASNLGIASFLNNPSPPKLGPSEEEQERKRVKLEQEQQAGLSQQIQPQQHQLQTPQQHQQPPPQLQPQPQPQQQYPPYLPHGYINAYGAPHQAPPTMTFTHPHAEQQPQQQHQIHQQQVSQSPTTERAITQSPPVQKKDAQTTQSPESLTQQHNQSHHHHHRHHHSHSPHHHHQHHHHVHHPHQLPTAESASIPHIHSGNHIHILSPSGQVKTEKSEKVEKVNKQEKGKSKSPIETSKALLEKKEQPVAVIEKSAEPPKQKAADQLAPVQKTRRKIIKREFVPPVVLNVGPILELIHESFPERHFLGTIIYNPTTTWSNLQTSNLYGLKREHQERFSELKEEFETRSKDPFFRKKYIPSIPPLSNEYINSVVEVKIPYQHIDKFRHQFDKSVVLKREVWGGASGVYTDDSDILTVLAHQGFFRNSINLRQWNPKWEASDIIKPLNSFVADESNDVTKAAKENADQEIYKAQESNEEILGDLSVEVLLLPPLPEYHGYYANGINARSWISSNKHNGLSIAIYNVKWESSGAHARDKSVFKKYESELRQDSIDNDEVLVGRKGWSFDYACYKHLKEKYSALEKKGKSKDIEGLPEPATTPAA